MKMNKIIIPAAMMAVGIALVGSVSSTLAWYQFSTKAQAAYIGTSVGETENLEIKVKDGDPVNNEQAFKWVSNAKSADVAKLVSEGYGTNVLPLTPAAYDATTNASGNYAKNVAAPANFYHSINRNVAGHDAYGSYATTANYVQFKLNIRYNKASLGASTTNAYLAKKLSLVDLTIVSDKEVNNAAVENDLWKAVRVHISSTDNNATSPVAYNKLFARSSTSKIAATTENVAEGEVITNTYGNLDTDNDGDYDTGWNYEWENAGAAIVYGVDGSKQTAINAAYGDLDEQVGVIPANAENGVELTVTIWIEGWQKLSGIPAGNKDDTTSTTDSSAMWDPDAYINAHFKVGLRFSAEDIPAPTSTNP